MNTYKPKDFAKMLGVTVRTLQKWDVAGKLKAFRTPTNRRFYTQEQLDVYMGNSTRVQNQKKVILYASVILARVRQCARCHCRPCHDGYRQWPESQAKKLE